jgi:uncharacterized protein RhaS with RHS repeats
MLRMKFGVVLTLSAMVSMAACVDRASSTAPATGASGGGNSQRVSSKYDASGKLEMLEYDRNNDGKPDAWGFMNGTQVVRVEVDENGDGVVDRWEFHRLGDNAGGSLGVASAGDRTLEHIERATKFDGKVSRWEYFTDGMLTRIEEDTDGDGKVDKWESYRAGTLETLSLDTQGRGTPNRRLVYAPDGSLVRMEADATGSGTFRPLEP